MSKIAVGIHGGARPDSEFIRTNINGYKKALKESAELSYDLLKRGKCALDAAEAAISFLEDCVLFNAGRGSAINSVGMVEMDASIMDGNDLRCGAVALLRFVKNPVGLARLILEDSHHVLLGGEGAIEYAKNKGVKLEHEGYFVVPHQYDAYMKKRDKLSPQEKEDLKNHGTVGVIALDKKGNIASATSTGGTSFNKQGRIGDAAMIGIGCYADNRTCGVCATGDGEINIRTIAAGYVSMLVEQKLMNVQEACDYVIHQKNKHVKGDMGLIALDKYGNFATAHNSELMHRAWITPDQELTIKVYEK
ncbi:MAG: isoaspartyl peptidase/L-asparaginase [Bacteroidetes bacterium]|nr:isoaspartyl peptidase/L-asparaginase [Bacteroidota bacterium]